jgi:phosphohistidine phosphatase
MEEKMDIGRSLYLFRHGKSDWAAAYEDDHDRPLAKRGRKAARRMGRWLARLGECPEVVLASSAVRAQQTLVLAQQAGDWPKGDIAMSRAVYEATTPEDLMALLAKAAPEATRVLLVGHEPLLSELIGLLTGGQVRFPTAAIARIDLPGTADAVPEPGSGQLQWLVTPRLVG